MTTDSETIDTMARTIWGEARGCGTDGMRHVAMVIVNRAAHPSWWGHDIESVCLAPWQFSCRNPGDSNRAKLLSVTSIDPEFATAVAIATQAVHGSLQDETGNADSYYATSMRTPPTWTATAERTFSDGWHIFYRTARTSRPSTIANISVHAAPEDEADRLDDEFNPTA